MQQSSNIWQRQHKKPRGRQTSQCRNLLSHHNVGVPTNLETTNDVLHRNRD